MATDPERTPTPEELEEVGVEVTRPAPQPPRRTRFREAKLQGEPETDRKITLLDEDMVLRERIVQTSDGRGVQSSADAVAPTARSLTISLALLDAEGGVVRNSAGEVLIAPAHETLLIGENMARLGTQEAVAEAIKMEREVAAAKAADHFKGMELMDAVLGDRVKISEE